MSNNGQSQWTEVTFGKRHSGRGGIYAPYYDQPIVAITPRGEILITPFVAELLGKPKYVRILHDMKNLRFAIVPTDLDAANTLAVNYNIGGKKNQANGQAYQRQMARIGAQSFVRGVGLMLDSDHVALLRGEVDHEGFFVIDMRQGRTPIPYIHHAPRTPKQPAAAAAATK